MMCSSMLFKIVQKKLADLIKAAAKEERTKLQDLWTELKGLKENGILNITLYLPLSS